MKTRQFFKQLLQYPSALIGMLLIMVLVGVSIVAVVKYPYAEAVVLWRGGENIWYKNPRQAGPIWYNWFSKVKQPVSFDMKSDDDFVDTQTVLDSKGNAEIVTTYSFDYNYDSFPQEMAVYFSSSYTSQQPFVSMKWVTPDSREIRISDMGVGADTTYRFAQDARLKRMLGGDEVMTGLFKQPESDPAMPLKGTYQLVVTSYTSEPDSNVESEFVLHGTLYGWAGTDHLRRDIGIALLWGTPIALLFGLLAALGTTVMTMIIAAVGVWYAGWVDGTIQRITEVNMVLPFLPILIMIGTFYSRSIWIILGATIALSIFGPSIKTYRAMFLQVKESGFVEAARSYGASNSRIIFRYLTPRLIPTLIPQLVTLIPAYVFLEATLAFLGLGDPVMPTWGKIINDAQANGAMYQGLYYWILEPAFLLIIAGLAFALLGFAMDRIFNPKLRGM